MDRLSKGMPPLLSSIQSTCTSSYSYRHSLSTIYCRYEDQKVRINVQLTVVYHACFIPSMTGGFGLYVATELSTSLDFVALQKLDHNVALAPRL